MSQLSTTEFAAALKKHAQFLELAECYEIGNYPLENRWRLCVRVSDIDELLKDGKITTPRCIQPKSERLYEND